MSSLEEVNESQDISESSAEDSNASDENVVPSIECTVLDTDSESEEEKIVLPKNKRLLQVIDSDSEDEDGEDERAISPRTRMSITGVRPSDLTDDSSSEIDHTSSDEEDSTVEVIANSSAEEEEVKNESTKKNSNVGLFDEENVEKKFGNLSMQHQASKKSPRSSRYTSCFENEIKKKLSSTLHMEETVQTLETSDDSEVKVLEAKNETIEIFSSDDDDQPTTAMSSKRPSAGLIQPTLNAAARRRSSTNKNKLPEMKTAAMQIVSSDFYRKEVRKLEEIKIELRNTEQLFHQCSKNLPDKGRQLILHTEKLRNDLEIKAKYISTLSVNDNQEKPAEKKGFIKTPDWDELSAAVNKIEPIHKGKQGLATFNNQRVLTLDRLKDLHGSLETCPAEHVLADEPEGLKVSLMAHQRHALAWMTWREKQKPRGGILADDMGLGKTLTTISMVLARKQSQDKENMNEDSDEEENSSWTGKGKRQLYNGGTLIICPASLIRQWEDEVNTKVGRHKLSVCVHHGNQRETKGKHLRNFDIVVTTYQIVSREHKSRGAIFNVKWQRIVLDEAHIVRNHKAQSSLAVCELRARCRWTLTGTPIQNKEMDVYALLKFLRCSPFDDLGHWKRWIDNKSAGGQQRLNTVLKTLMLRRTKALLQESGALKCLPDKRIVIKEIDLDKDEMNVYQKVMLISRSLFAQYLMQHADRQAQMGHYGASSTQAQKKDPYYKLHQQFSALHKQKEVKSHEILMLLLRLRQICCHPGLIHAMLEDEDLAAEQSDSDNDRSDINLLEQLNKLTIDDNNGSEKTESLAKASSKILLRSNAVFNERRPSSKMVLVMETLRKEVLNGNDKAIVVSQWTSYLDILRTYLEENGIATLSLNGKIPVKDRQSVVNTFNSSSSQQRVLLLSLTAGGVGLNLIGGNHLMLMDLHWNPQLEAQAQDRIYRVGQKKNVIIHKFMCKNTVEERIKALQDRKLEIASSVLTGAKATGGSKLTIDDLRSLFDL